jgi:hypothetical protein
MKNKNIINKELKIKVEKFWSGWNEMVKDSNLKSEIEKCFDLYEECEGDFEDKEEEKYVLMMIFLSEDILECSKSI